MNDNKAYAASLKASMARQSITDMTVAESTISLGNLAAIESAATRNGMTTQQMAAAMYVQSIASKLPAEAKAILANKDTAFAALSRIANLRSGDDHEDLAARIATAILS